MTGECASRRTELVESWKAMPGHPGASVRPAEGDR